MFDFSQLSDRINYGLKKSGKNQSRLAEECGVKSSSVNGWTSGKTKDLMSTVAYKASRSLNLNLNWLITGKGEPEGDPVVALDIVYGDEVRVKRLIQLMNGDLIIHSENPQYPDETIHKGDEINFRIIGRVIDKSGSGGL